MTRSFTELKELLLDDKEKATLMSYCNTSNDPDDKITRVIESIINLLIGLERGEDLHKVVDFISHSLDKAELELYHFNKILKLFEGLKIQIKVKDRLYFHAGIDGLHRAAEAFLNYGQKNSLPFSFIFKLLTTILSLAVSQLLGDEYDSKVDFKSKDLIQDITTQALSEDKLLDKYNSILDELELLGHMIILEKNLARNSQEDLWDEYCLTSDLIKVITSKKHKSTGALEKKFQGLNLLIRNKYKKLEIDLVLQLLKDKNLLAILNNPDYKRFFTTNLDKKNFNKEDIFTTEALDKIFRRRDLAKARQIITSLVAKENLSFESVKYLIAEARKIMAREKFLAMREEKNIIGALVNP